MFGLLSLARDRAPSLLSVPIDCYLAARAGKLACCCAAAMSPNQHSTAATVVNDAAKGISMSISTQTQNIKKKPHSGKSIPQAKVAPKAQPTGLSREELRQIVLEILG
jgi:hypothetical protein